MAFGRSRVTPPDALPPRANKTRIPSLAKPRSPQSRKEFRMKYFTKKSVGVVLVVLLLLPVVSQAQFGGFVYDPTNYANAFLRYNQLIRQLSHPTTSLQHVLHH